MNARSIPEPPSISASYHNGYMNFSATVRFGLMPLARQTLTRLVHAPLDLDYVENFQALARLNLEIERHGPSAPRLLRRAVLEMDVGNYEASYQAAKDALVLNPESGEAHFQRGLACLLMACVQADAIAGAPGMEAPRGMNMIDLVREASEAFGKAAHLNPDDEEAVEGLAQIGAILVNEPSEAEVREHLVSL